MENNNQQNVGVTPLSLPKGGGAITGMGESLGAIGPSGIATLTLPLPISSGRGYAPELALSYSSDSGNGPFGLGWNINTMSIQRRTGNGAPNYDSHDEFIAPNGEVLLAVSAPKYKAEYSLPGFTIIHYQPRVEGRFDRIEFWQPENTNLTQTAFWLIYAADGQVYCFGRSAQAQIADPEHPTHIAKWLLEESVSPTGEHICYRYKNEDDVNADSWEKNRHPQACAQRYLHQVQYGNREVFQQLYILSTYQPNDSNWLFTLVFDYGERLNNLSDVPALKSEGQWPCRQDPFSRYEYGFEVRTRRLCQQVLMFHNVQALAGRSKIGRAELVARLRLSYLATPYATQLISCQQVAHEKDGTALTLPPLEFDYQQFQAETETSWQAMPEWDKFNPYYQLVDLNGEGLPGMLNQEDDRWCYHPPMRQPDSENGVSFGHAQILPTIPSLQDNASLMDINGDGQLDWVVSQCGIAGYYCRNPEESWTQFTPLSALPAEYFHPQAQLADLIGDGISDLALIGPKSVRLYANQRNGFASAQLIYQDEAVTLPIPGGSQHELVAFSDPFGSGQQHLLRVRHDSVTCWPNLSHGRFGKPVTLSGFSQPAESFNPQSIRLADIDGSGSADLIYANSDHLLIYRNQSGNSFAPPLKLPLPHGVRYDNTCQLTLADVQGLGVTSLLLSVPHMSSRHWRYDLTTTKPYLLCTVNNNMGAENHLFYRSSAQLWLDEKAAAAAEGRTIACRLPFPLHLLVQTEQLDEITGNTLKQEARYYHGFYDGIEREFRGFGRVDVIDTHADAQGSSQERTAPSLSRSWFHTGRADDETRYRAEYWQGDDLAYSLGHTRLTTFNSADNSDDLLIETSVKQTYWLYRALKGSPLHTELYGLDNIELNNLPYTCNSTRYQVRQVRLSNNDLNSPIVMPMQLEQLSYHYERTPQDPQCSQQIVLRSNEYGHPLHSVSINYPRRAPDKVTPYSWMATDHWASSYDEQQCLLRLTESQQSYYQVIQEGGLRLGLPWQQRSDVLTYHAHVVPINGLNYEIVTQKENALGGPIENTFAGQNELFYHPNYPLMGLVIAMEHAEFDDTSLGALDEMLPAGKARDDQLISAGYQLTPRLFARAGEADVWTARRGLTDYSRSLTLFRPIAQRSTQLVGATKLVWDHFTCAVTQIQMADGSTTTAKYDYRFITPYHLTDLNDNEHTVSLDAFGRVISLRFWGTELDSGMAVECGFRQSSLQPFIAPTCIEDVIAQEYNALPVAQYTVYQPFSWMVKPSPTLINECLKHGSTRDDLIQNQLMTEEGYLYTLGSRRWLRQNNSSLAQIVENEIKNQLRQPPHTITVMSENYDSKTQQGKLQQRQVIMYHDGFGRTLQVAQRVEAGEAYIRDEDGSLRVKDNQPLIDVAHQRWAVSGRREYDNKGLAVRTYQPYFLNDWRYVRDDSARKDTYADTHSYDPLGRAIKVITAKGYLCRTQYFPWFVISEDENDTAVEVNGSKN
ncbi:SpvB/TcaC N-terminal domain-containing protein [Yersinia bercovieri]|uniref:SpvB/TcaC N-terminal domain-containing protein n=1 Tax=Yersinia bercovieri TaxID=634 RepID=UPI0011AB33D0|nr:SpvB/TcaC N-terminal domain-containing protein [Yersinia bercovieri]